MNHIRHAPETNVEPATGADPALAALPLSFQYARVKTSDTSSVHLPVAVPFDFGQGITTQFRTYYPDPTSDPGCVDVQVAPDNKPLPPLVKNDNPSDPYGFAKSYVGTITVHMGDKTVTCKVSTDQADAVPVDITNGVNVRYWFDDNPQALPIGPLLNIDITQGP